MTAARDPDQLIHRFLLEGSERLPDQVYDAVRAEIEHKRQRVVIGPWRTPIMSKFAPIGLAAAAVVVAFVIGTQLIGPRAPDGMGAPPIATPSPTPAPSAAASPSSAVGGLPEGPFTIVDEGAPNAPVRTTVTIPSSGWIQNPEFGALYKGDDADPPEAAILAWSWPAGTGIYVYGDPCRWESTTPETPATTVDEIVTALAAQALRDASAPVDVTVDGHAGKHISMHVPTDPEASAGCDDNTFASYGERDPANGPSRYHQGPGQIDELWVLDVDGTLVILDAMYRPDTPVHLIEELRAIAESATFE